MRALAALVLGTLVVAVCLAVGLWWATFVVGAAVGLLLWRGAIITGALVGLLGWAGPLVWLALFHPLVNAATVISGVMGFAGLGPAPALALTLLFGLVLGLSGAWLGHAVRALVVPRRRQRETARSPG